MNSTFFLLPLLAVVTNEDLWFLLAAVLLQLGLFAACLRLRHPAIAGIAAIVLGLVAIAVHVLAKEGVDYSQYSKEAKSTVLRSATIASSVKALLDTPILSEDGALTPESEELVESLGVKLLEA